MTYLEEFRATYPDNQQSDADIIAADCPSVKDPHCPDIACQTCWQREIKPEQTITPEFWLACHEHCRPDRQSFGCGECPASTGHLDSFGFCTDCKMDLEGSAAEVIRWLMEQLEEARE